MAVAALLMMAVGWVYFYPSTAILTAVKVRGAIDTARVAPPRDIAWQQGPLTALARPADRSPNIGIQRHFDLWWRCCEWSIANSTY